MIPNDVIISISNFADNCHTFYLNKQIYSEIVLNNKCKEWHNKYINLVKDQAISGDYNWKQEYIRILKTFRLYGYGKKKINFTTYLFFQPQIFKIPEKYFIYQTTDFSLYGYRDFKLLYGNGNRTLNDYKIWGKNLVKKNNISLIGCKLDEVPFPTIDKDLMNLNICANKIISVPKEMILCENLVTLDLAFNEIKYIPQELFKLKNLEEVNLGYNLIKKLPDHIPQNLKRLYLNNNELTSIPQEYYKLDTLNVKFNRIIILIVLNKNKFIPETIIGSSINFIY